MSKAAPGGRPTLNGIEASGAYPVEYKFSHAKNGNRHLVVVFANFSAPDEYGWSNGVFDNLRANILWIRDLFDGKNSYYLCKGMDFSLESSVVALISNVMRSLSLTPDDCTMFGGSKGGSAALYFGLKYGFRNIVSIVPQFLVGSYVLKHPTVARFMMGDVSEANVRILDSVLPDLVRQGTHRGANIYMVSSPQDEQYKDQVEPFLGLFQGYENFNFVYSDSPLITDHTQATRRNVPILMGIVNFLIDGIAPRFGFVRNGYEQLEADKSGINAYLQTTAKVQIALAVPVLSAPVTDQRLPLGPVRFAGSAAGAVRVSIWENGKFLGSPDVAADGTWAWDLGKAWTKGKHVVRMFAVDPTGYHSERTEVSFTVAGQGATAAPAGPAPVFSVPAPNQQVPGIVGFMGHAQGAVRVEFLENRIGIGGTDVMADGSWAWTWGRPWGEGEHTVEAFAVDAAGHVSVRSAVTFTVMNAFAGPAPQRYAPQY